MLGPERKRTLHACVIKNIAVGEGTALNELFDLIRTGLAAEFPHLSDHKPVYHEFGVKDVRLRWRPIRSRNDCWFTCQPTGKQTASGVPWVDA